MKVKFRNWEDPFCYGGSRKFSSFLYKMGNTGTIVWWGLVSSDLGVTKQTYVSIFCADKVEMWPMNVRLRCEKAMRSFMGSQHLFEKCRYPGSEHNPLNLRDHQADASWALFIHRNWWNTVRTFYCLFCISLSSLQTWCFETWCFRAGSVVSRLFHQCLNIIPGTCFIRLGVSGSNMCNAEFI